MGHVVRRDPADFGGHRADGGNCPLPYVPGELDVFPCD